MGEAGGSREKPRGAKRSREEPKVTENPVSSHFQSSCGGHGVRGLGEWSGVSH